ncbi:hypothetical protein HYU95_04525 [Candidatus Daviesbacteria bacterium]|nr:hypothetical protein [Candidatus Daviesbacteria bacterium]
MSKFFINQKGIAPIILIIILTVVIAGVAGVAYQSRKEIKVRSDKTSEVTELKGTPAPEPKGREIDLADSGRLADKPVELKVDDSTASSPKFSITPPAGWQKLPPEDNTIVEFLSPSKDEIEEGVATFNVQPNITVFVGKKEFKDLDEVIAALDKNGDTFGYKKTNSQKTRINGEDAYVKESTVDLAQLARQVLETQVKQEIAKSGTKIPEDVVQKDIEKVLVQAKGRALTYIFYKNGYYFNVTGKAMESYWSKREGQLRKSMDTFKFE